MSINVISNSKVSFKLLLNFVKMVDVKIEYCGVCDYKRKCHELAVLIKEKTPDSQVKCIKGRTGSFEVIVNDVLVHSKLKTMAHPEFGEVVTITQNASKGLPIKEVAKHQPIKDCVIM